MTCYPQFLRLSVLTILGKVCHIPRHQHSRRQGTVWGSASLKLAKCHLWKKLGSQDPRQHRPPWLQENQREPQQAAEESSAETRQKVHCKAAATAGNPRLAAGTSAAQSLQKDQTESIYPGCGSIHGGSVSISAMQAVCSEEDWNAEESPAKTHEETAQGLPGSQRAETVTLFSLQTLSETHQNVQASGFSNVLVWSVNVDLKLDAINQHLTAPVEGQDELSELSVCPYPTLSCLDRTCKEFGVQCVEQKIKAACKSEMTAPVKWYMWQMVKKEKGQRREKIMQDGTLGDLLYLGGLLSDLMKELKPLTKHIFTHKWQHKDLKQLLAKMQSLPRTAVVLNDFSENYLCKYQDKVQSAHWGYNQVTIHPIVLY